MSCIRFCVNCVLLIPLFAIGCSTTTTEKVTRDQLPASQETVSSVVLTDGTEITFDSKGGKYQVYPVASGVTIGGDSVSIPITEGVEVRGDRPSGVSRQELDGKKITEVVLADSTLLRFNKSGGAFSSDSLTLSGRNEQGEIVFAPVRQVTAFRTAEPRLLTPIQYDGKPPVPIAELVIPPRNHIIDFALPGGRVQSTRELFTGKTAQGRFIHLELDQILFARVTRVDAGKLVLAILGGIAAAVVVVGVIVAATKESCPFVYSFDGSQYRFDAEPLGGATTKALARTDYSKLKYLWPVQGEYRLLVRNEVAETQYIDAMSLAVVDHDPSDSIVADGSGGFYAVHAPLPPFLVTDEDGRKFTKVVSAIDGIPWQTDMTRYRERLPSVKHHTLTFFFPKPKGAKRAQLIAHVGTTLWGSGMIRTLYELYGKDVDAYHEKLDRGGKELYDMLAYMGREELFTLKVYVGKQGTWVERGTLSGGGPYVYETQAIPLSVSSIAEDTLAIQVRPPLGFWSIDYMGIVYDDERHAESQTVEALSAIDQDGNTLMEELQARDNQCCVMSTRSQTATLRFPVPPQCAGTARTVFLKSSGYYRLHLPKDHPADTAALEQLASTPGAVVDFSLERYRVWNASIQALVHERLEHETAQ
jgi:hypothetical protein